MRIELEKRAKDSRLYSFLSPILALVLTAIAGAIMFALLGKSPVEALYLFFIQPLTDPWSLDQIAIKAGPLILMGVGLSIAYRAKVWNIGAEGQYTVGAITGSILPILLPDYQNWTVLPLMMIMGALGGAAFAAIPAFLKARLNTNEILTSLMLVYISQLFLDWLVRGIWRDPGGMNFPVSLSYSPSAVLPPIFSSYSVHWEFVFALVVAVAGWFMMNWTLKGFEVTVLGESERAGRFAGFSGKRMIWFAMLLSGGLAGLAGISEVSGSIGHLQPAISPGYGFTAIIVAFLGRLSPLGSIASGLVLSLTYVSGEGIQMPPLELSDKVSRVFQGMMLFFVLSCDTLIRYKIRIVWNAFSSRIQGGA